MPSQRSLRIDSVPRPGIPLSRPVEPPFQQSLRILLTSTAQEAGAAGYALYEFDESRGTLAARLSHGIPQRQPGLYPVTIAATPLHIANGGPDGPAILSFPLHGEVGLAGVLDFGFSAPHALTENGRVLVARTAAAVADLLKAGHAVQRLARLTAQVARLEIELAERKIDSRAEGVQAEPDAAGRAAQLQEHIARVLRAKGLEAHLSAQASDLEQKIRERHVIAQAKDLVRQNLGSSEEHAYLTIRNLSRKNRTPLVHIAREIIEGRLTLQLEP